VRDPVVGNARDLEPDCPRSGRGRINRAAVDKPSRRGSSFSRVGPGGGGRETGGGRREEVIISRRSVVIGRLIRSPRLRAPIKPPIYSTAIACNSHYNQPYSRPASSHHCPRCTCWARLASRAAAKVDCRSLSSYPLHIIIKHACFSCTSNVTLSGSFLLT
jgi:hypothetical protein